MTKPEKKSHNPVNRKLAQQGAQPIEIDYSDIQQDYVQIFDPISKEVIGEVPVVGGKHITAVRPTLITSTFLPKIDYYHLLSANLKASELQLAFKLFAQMSRDSILKGYNDRYLRGTYAEMAKQLKTSKTTLNDTMRRLLENDVIREWMGIYVVNPLFTYKFSRSKVPGIILAVYEDLIRYQPITDMRN